MINRFAQIRNVLRIGAGASLALAAVTLCAQTPAVRIPSEISSSQMAVLRGSQLPQANPQFDAGRMPANTRLNGISIYFKPSPAQEADLQALLVAQQDPASPLYHQWLTPDQFAARFGMASQDIATVETWLQQQGFTIDYVNRSRNAVHFSGTVGQFESAFQTQMHYYSINGVRKFGPSTAISVPAAIAPVVQAVTNVSDLNRPRPMHIGARSAFTSNTSGNVFFAPGDIKTTYDMNPLISGGYTGIGQTIAIMGQSFVNVSDIEAFEAAANLPKKDPNMVLVPGTGTDGTPTSGDESESDLDLEWSGAMAPGASIVFVYTGYQGSNPSYGVYDSAAYAVDQKIGNIISLSYSSCELGLNATQYSQIDAIFKQAAAQGQTVLAASGDSGSTACFGDKTMTLAQQETESANYPASSAYVTGIGGTEITAADSTSSNSTYWIAASGSDVLTSAKTYIPEVAWNDDSTTVGLSSSGGGISTLVPRPAWQTGVPGIPSGSMRLIPDISFYSSPNYPGYLYCTSDTSSLQTNQQGSCTNGFRDSSTSGYLTVAGGTSFATPIFAGMLADLNQKLGYTTGQGLINPTLYKLAGNSSYYPTSSTAYFHDVTSGNNGCANAGTQYCSGTTGYSAGTGYDMVTGLGSIDVGNIANIWPANTGAGATLMATTTTVVAATAQPTVNTSDTFTITVAPAGTGTGVPTGTVTLIIDGGPNYSGPANVTQTLSATGTATYSATFSSTGTHQIVAQYSGDAMFAASTGIGEVTIPVTSSGKGSFAMALSPSTLTVSQGSKGTETMTVTPSGGYTGTISLSYSTSNQTALANLCLIALSGFDSSGNIAVTGSSAAQGTFSVDTNPADCGSSSGGTGGVRHNLLVHASNVTRAANNNAPRKNPVPMGVALAGLLFVGWFGRSSRKLRNLVCVLAFAAIAFGISACGNSAINPGNNTPSSPPKGTYTITFTGTDSANSSLTASQSFTLTIN
ncbi:MAG: protease pro-enzyme activation domain-containing protein [Acidobacteriota bacterium]